MEIWNRQMKALRKGTNVTLKEMADLMGVSEATAQRYESGAIINVPYKAIITYAEKFNVSPCQIMGWTNTDENRHNISNYEFQIIEKFRVLDERGRNNVLDTLDREYSYAVSTKKGSTAEGSA